MTTASQERSWQALHRDVGAVMDRFGTRNAFREGDYWLLDENWGRFSQQIEIQNLKLLSPHIVRLLQQVLKSYTDWYVTIRVDVPGQEQNWPGMGLLVYADRIDDDLKREYLPPEFRDMKFD